MASMCKKKTTMSDFRLIFLNTCKKPEDQLFAFLRMRPMFIICCCNALIPLFCLKILAMNASKRRVNLFSIIFLKLPLAHSRFSRFCFSFHPKTVVSPKGSARQHMDGFHSSTVRGQLRIPNGHSVDINNNFTTNNTSFFL